jgi:hypothetical protein
MINDAISSSIIPNERIEKLILSIRGRRVIIDEELATLYGVETKYLNRAVRRNLERFPEDFMFHLSIQEVTDLRCQFGTSSSSYGGRRYAHYAFTEHGILMLSSVLNSPRSIQVNIEIMRTFTRLREMFASHKELSEKLARLEKKYDSQFRIVFDSIRDAKSKEHQTANRLLMSYFSVMGHFDPLLPRRGILLFN